MGATSLHNQLRYHHRPSMDVNTNKIDYAEQSIEDAYGEPTNFLELEVREPLTHGFGRHRYTDYELHMVTNLPIFKKKSVSVRRRYSDFEWLKAEVERDA